MSFSDLLIDRCTIQSRVVDTSGKTDTETFADIATNVPCRVFKNSSTLYNANKAQHSTIIKTRIALLATQSVSIRGRIVHEGRTYKVVDVIPGSDARTRRHLVAICEAIAGEV